MKKALIFIVSFLAVNVFAAGDIKLEDFSETAGVGVNMKQGKGHQKSRAAVASGDTVGFIRGFGYNGSSFPSSAGVGVDFAATEDWTTTANGTQVLIKTTPNGSATATTVATFGQDGSLTVTGGFTAPGLQVNTPTSYTIGAATEVTPTSSFGVFTTTGTGAITWACTNSCISTSVANGTIFTVMSATTTNITMTDSVTMQFSTTTFSTNRVLSNVGDNWVGRLYNGVWYEVSFSTGHE